MSTKNLIRERATKLSRLITPAQFGQAILILAGVVVWTAYLFLPDTWQVREAPTKGARLLAEQQQPAVNNQTFMGPQTSPGSAAFYQYSGRLEEQTAIVLALAVTALHENLRYGRNPQDLPTLINQARSKKLSEKQRLWLADWDEQNEINRDSGWIKGHQALHYVYFRPDPFGLEVKTVSLNGDPQITVVRIPERAGSKVIQKVELAPEGFAGVALYVSPQTPVRLLPAWSSTAAYEQSGWKREALKLSFSTGRRHSELERLISDQASR